jgi:hypothetical protein
VVGFVLDQDRPQMSLAEDQHPVGDLEAGERLSRTSQPQSRAKTR